MPARFPTSPRPTFTRPAAAALITAAVAALSPAAAAPPPAPPPWAAPLFAPSPPPLTLAITHTARRYDPEDPKANDSGVVTETATAALTCLLAPTTLPATPKGAALTPGPALAARLTCEGADYSPPFTLFIYTDKGLWAADADLDPSDLADLLRGPPLLTPKPRAGEVFKREDAEGFGASLTVKAEGDGWCASSAAWGGDEAWETLCLTPTQGLSSQLAGWAGGSEVETTFTRAPK